tara:strand:+ start:536 stop:706 length:171 start_codon:yes stop_codon:yes gene_type:complete
VGRIVPGGEEFTNIGNAGNLLITYSYRIDSTALNWTVFFGLKLYPEGIICTLQGRG